MFGFRKRREERDALSLKRSQSDTRVANATVRFCGGISLGTLESRNLGRFLYERLTAREQLIFPPVQYAIELLGGPKAADSISDWCRNYLENESPEIRLERLADAVRCHAHCCDQSDRESDAAQYLANAVRLAELEREPVNEQA